MKSARGFLKLRIGVGCRNFAALSDAERPRRLNSALRYLDIDERVSKAIDEGTLHPKNHPGMLKYNTRFLPSAFKQAIDVALEGKDISEIVKEGALLQKQLYGRSIPKDPRAIDYIIKKETQRAQSFVRGSVDFSAMDEEQQKRLQAVENKIALQKSRELIHPWKPLDISPKTCLMYLVSRTPAEFVVLHRVFSEIKHYDPNFEPSTFFDFGSGVASGFWALQEVWKKPISEAFHVDVNANMNDLASAMIKQSTVGSVRKLGLFFRQFLPASPTPTYDVVLSAFSLLELPTLEDRIQVLFKLWEKTNSYLVVVEDGTKAGYNLVMEARDFISKVSRESKLEDFSIVAPCPHDLECPTFVEGKHPCYFQVQYYTLPLGVNTQILKRHNFSYVVFRKGPKLENLKWSRCVLQPLKASRLVRFKVCTPNGKVDDVILTKGKNSHNAYSCAKYTKWGDLLPGELIHSEKDSECGSDR